MAYETDEYGNTYYVPDAQVPGRQGDWDWGGGGLSGALSGAGTGAQLGSMFGGIPGALIGGTLGFLGGGWFGAQSGGEELDRARALEQAQLKARREARKRAEQAYREQSSALRSQRAMIEAANPAEALYGTQGRPGLLQVQQAQLAQQMAAQGARNRAALASRGLLGSGMEAGSMGALAGQQAGRQAQLQANIAQQYMQQQQAQQQQLGQLAMQQAQLSSRQAGVRSQMDMAALQGQAQQAQQLALRNQQLMQAGLQGVSAGLGAYQQGQALAAQREQTNAFREAAGLARLPESSAPFQTQAQGIVDWAGQAGQNVMSGLGQAGQSAMSGLGAFGQQVSQVYPEASRALQTVIDPQALRAVFQNPARPLPSSTMPRPPARLSPAQREVVNANPEYARKMLERYEGGSYVAPSAYNLGMPNPNVPTIGNPTYSPGPFDIPPMPPADLGLPKRSAPAGRRGNR